MLFTGETGSQYGYIDGWSEEGVFFYTGEGQRGDMPFVRGNLAIREHIANGKDIHLFELVSRRFVKYLGQMMCTGFQERLGPDVDGNERKVIVFELAPLAEFDENVLAADKLAEDRMWQQSLSSLRERAIASSTAATSPRERKAYVRNRSRAIRVYVLKRADGVCEGCGVDAPFLTGSGRPYLESHHIRSISDAGPDDPLWVGALCPNCHRRAHHSADISEFNKEIAGIVGDKEQQLGL
jgi:5-methylcytosine-specific restriction protein A